jgi:hypothetical protein
MDNKEFEDIFDGMVATARATLLSKSKEYATDEDRLHNFKAAAGALNCSPARANRGMSTKHTISINDMVDHPEKYTMAQWEEKIGDEFNYLILLKAIVWERLNEASDEAERDVSIGDGPPLTESVDWASASSEAGRTWLTRPFTPNATMKHSGIKVEARFADAEHEAVLVKWSHGASQKHLAEDVIFDDEDAPKPVELPYYPTYGDMHEAHPGVGKDFTWVRIDDLHESKRTLNPDTDINVHGILYRKVNL